MKKLVGLLTLLLVYHFSTAQRISTADEKFLQLKEDSMKTLAVTIIQGRNPEDRLKADSSFTRLLMRALKTKYSFYYSFDSLATISMLYAPDSSFKIFTWQLMINDNVIRHHGVIQKRTPDGSLIRFPLIDKSIVTTNLKDTVTNHLAWVGAIYYRIIHKKVYERNYYTFLGFDANNIRSDRKIIEVMTFENNEPVFGGRYFSFEDDALASKTINSRYIMEYKKDAGPRLSYDPDLDMIIAEHLVSESGEPNKKWTLIGDGDYEGFKWTNGRWMHVNKVYNYVTPQGKEPVPKPIRDNGGNLNDNKLEIPDPTDPKTKPVKPKKNGQE